MEPAGYQPAELLRKSTLSSPQYVAAPGPHWITMMNRGNIFQSRVAGPFPIEPEAVRRNVAVNVLEFSTSTECENDLQTPTTTLLCAGGTIFACFDYLLSILLVDGNVLMGPRLVVRIQWGMLIWSLRPPVTAPRCLHPAQHNPSFSY
jgi:hypothetical protein